MRSRFRDWLMPPFLVCLALASCGIRNDSGVLPSPAPTPSATLASPTEELCSPAEVSCGAVRGRLFLTNGLPAVGSIVYLSEYVGPEETPLVVLDPAKHLRTQTGEGGAFCFSEVPSGRYALIVWDAVDSFLLDDPATDFSLAIDVEPSRIADIGTVYTPVP